MNIHLNEDNQGYLHLKARLTPQEYRGIQTAMIKSALFDLGYQIGATVSDMAAKSATGQPEDELALIAAKAWDIQTEDCGNVIDFEFTQDNVAEILDLTEDLKEWHRNAKVRLVKVRP